MRVACVQLVAREVEDSERALEEALALAAEAAARADLVVLPEATYPGYVLHDATPHRDPARYERALDAFAEVAREHRAWITVGLVRPAGTDLMNSAVLLDPEGRVTSITDKAFLWHFDRQWFRPGAPGEVAVLPPFGPAGVFVCADARMTEIPRRLAVAGARLLIDPTALVLSSLGTNAQLEYMLAARAWENGAFLAVANKCGAEAGIARYGGRSAIFDPSGARLAEAGAQDPEIIVAEVDLAEAPGPPVAGDPDGYPKLAASVESLPIAEVLAAGPPSAPLRLAMLRAGGEAHRLMTELDVDLGIGRAIDGPQVLSVVEGGLRLGSRTFRRGDVGLYGGLTIGMLSGDRLAVPEEARSLMLGGACLLVWDRAGADVPEEVLRTRADENRVFLIALEDADTWRIYGPTGALLGRGPQDGLEAVFIELPVALAWHKEMAPGTDVVFGRP